MPRGFIQKVENGEPDKTRFDRVSFSWHSKLMGLRSKQVSAQRIVAFSLIPIFSAWAGYERLAIIKQKYI